MDLNEEDSHTPIVANNTLYYGGARQSFLTLPVVTRKQLPRHLIPFLDRKPDCSEVSMLDEDGKMWCAARQLAKLFPSAESL